ncbi:MAG: hypothetical protein ACOCSE_05945 [Chitinivibrionales bacterium]
MIYEYLISGFTFIVLLIMFIVMSRTVNSVINYLLKVEYLLSREFEIIDEQREIEKLMKE